MPWRACEVDIMAMESTGVSLFELLESRGRARLPVAAAIDELRSVEWGPFPTRHAAAQARDREMVKCCRVRGTRHLVRATHPTFT